MGGSNSAYSLADQLELNPTFAAKWSDIDALVKKMRAEKMKPLEQVTLEPYERDHAVVVGMYRPPE